MTFRETFLDCAALVASLILIASMCMAPWLRRLQVVDRPRSEIDENS